MSILNFPPKPCELSCVLWRSKCAKSIQAYFLLGGSAYESNISNISEIFIILQVVAALSWKSLASFCIMALFLSKTCLETRICLCIWMGIHTKRKVRMFSYCSNSAQNAHKIQWKIFAINWKNISSFLLS